MNVGPQKKRTGEFLTTAKAKSLTSGGMTNIDPGVLGKRMTTMKPAGQTSLYPSKKKLTILPTKGGKKVWYLEGFRGRTPRAGCSWPVLAWPPS